jgi:hypothetical protein
MRRVGIAGLLRPAWLSLCSSARDAHAFRVHEHKALLLKILQLHYAAKLVEAGSNSEKRLREE